jgi:ribosomal protein S18 acetylase RimI-like enzyme
MNLELANSEQSQEIANLVNQAYRGEIGWTKEGHLVSGDRVSSKQIEDIILNKNSYLLITRDDVNIISCICIEEKDNNAYFGLFAVKPNIQSKGIGKQVLKLAEKYTKDILELDKIKMVVISQREELVSYYERRGYIKMKIHQEYPKNLDVGSPKIEGLTIEHLEKGI